MTPVTSRIVRGALLAIFLAVVVSVTLTLRRSAPAPGASPAAVAPSASPPPQLPETQQMEYRSFKGNRETYVIRAEKMVGGDENQEVQLSGVRMEFTYVAHGEQGRGTITADTCDYTKAIDKAVFRGNVVVTGQGGVSEMRTQSLVFRGDRQISKTDGPVQFKRKAISGTAVGMEYAATEERIELMSEVKIRIDDPDDPLTDITADRGVLDRDKGVMKLNGNVVLTRPGELLKAERLNADLTEQQTISRLEAEGGIELDSTATSDGAQAMGNVSGSRHLVAKRLEVFYGENGVMKTATAGPEADLTMSPGGGDPDRRRLQARFINFTFDEAGRLTQLDSNKDTTLKIEPVSRGKGQARTLTCQTMVAAIDPATGGMEKVTFDGDSVFKEGDRTATAESGSWSARQGILELQRKASLQEPSSLLEGQSITVNSSTNDVTAQGSVRHSLKGGAGGGATESNFLRDEEGAMIYAPSFRYDGKAKTADYTGGARLQSGLDSIKGKSIRIAEDAGGARTLSAEGEVSTRLTPRTKETRKDKGPGREAIKATSEKLRYDEKKREIEFEGNVDLKQGEITTQSPKATVMLEDDGSRVKSMVAGEPVTVIDKERKATGALATYTPAADTMVIVGPKVVLDDPGQQKVEGRSVTFKLSSDMILVDGLERGRTEMRMQRTVPSPQPSPSASPAAKKP